MEQYNIFLLRFFICFLLSALIGFEREYHNKVGLKINMLVGIGTYLFCTIALRFNEEEAVRIIAQIISGIGFLGAGSIVTNDNEIKGLNTATTIWCVTVIAILVSYGYIIEAICGTITVLFINMVLKSIKKLENRNLNNYQLKIKYERDYDINLSLNTLNKYIISRKVKGYLFNVHYNIIILELNNTNEKTLKSFVQKLKEDHHISKISYNISLNY